MLSLVEQNGRYALSVLNLADYSWICSEFETFEACSGELYKISPSEVILEKSLFGNTEIQEILQKKYMLNIYYYSF
jgi:DNA mismatch repair ATPase MutS